jgi:hypothetical protein
LCYPSGRLRREIGAPAAGSLAALSKAARDLTVAAPAKDATRLTLPSLAGYTVAIKTSDNAAVIAVNGTITPPADAWFGDAVKFVNERGIMGGSGAAQTFQPQQTMTRAMLITALARYDGVDTAAGDTWYSAAVNWGVASGMTDGSSLDDAVTREQLVTMLWRYAGRPQGGASFDEVTDADAISAWAVDAFRWAVEAGIVTGYDDKTVRPQSSAVRAEVAAILMRFISAAAAG